MNRLLCGPPGLSRSKQRLDDLQLVQGLLCGEWLSFYSDTQLALGVEEMCLTRGASS